MRRLRILAMPILVLVAYAASAGTAGDDGYRLWLDVAIDETGRITSSEPATELPGFLMSALNASIANLEVTPAELHGTPVPSTNGLFVEFGLVEHEGGLALEIWRHRVAPRRIRTVYPEYPPNELTKRHDGWVEVEFVVDEQGEPVDIEVKDVSDAMFISAAMRAVRQWRYSPPTIGGQPVATPVKARVRFSASGDE